MVSEMMISAMHFAEIDIPVFPLTPGSKIPLKGSSGSLDATKDRKTIYEWWTEEPLCNVGLAMGNGLVAIDIDEDIERDIHGMDSLRKWEHEYGTKLPDTIMSRTPRGGLHLIYRDPIGHRNRVGLYDGIDVRSERGYIVAPPSRLGEKQYQWERSPDKFEIATANDVVLAFLEGDSKPAVQDTFVMEDRIELGERTFTMIRLIGWMRSKGFSDDAIIAAIKVENAAKCEPPLSDEEMHREIFPALNRGWDVSHPYWKLKNEGDMELCRLQEKVKLLERKIQLMEEN